MSDRQCDSYLNIQYKYSGLEACSIKMIACGVCCCYATQVRCLRPDLAASADLYSKVEVPTHKQRVGIRFWLLDERTHTFCIGSETDDRPRSQVAWRLKAEVDRDAKALGQGAGSQPQQSAGRLESFLANSSLVTQAVKTYFARAPLLFKSSLL
jgi:hypothetical protein